jgi:hypothetical protein
MRFKGRENHSNNDIPRALEKSPKTISNRFDRPSIHQACNHNHNHGGIMTKHPFNPDDPSFEITGKRRKGFPSETNVGKGLRVVHGNKQLQEKLGRNDLCPCGSGRSFQKLLPALRQI